MSNPYSRSASGGLYAHAISDGRWFVTVGDNLEATVGTIEPSGDRWLAVRHRPVKDAEGGVYFWLLRVELGFGDTVEEATELFNTLPPISEATPIMDTAAGTLKCPVDGEVLTTSAPSGEAIDLTCLDCGYSAQIVANPPAAS